MTNSHQISPAQLYSIFFVSRILVTLTYIPALNEIALSSDLLVQAFLYPLGMIISALPLYALYQARPDWDIFDCAYRISPVLSKILAVLYALFFLFVALLSVTRFDLFATSRLFPDSDFTIFLLIIILISCAAAGFGLEALGRLSGLAVLLVAVTLGFVIAVLLPRFEPLNFTPLFYDGVMPTLRGTAAFLSGHGRGGGTRRDCAARARKAHKGLCQMDAVADAGNGASLLLRDFRAGRVLSNAALPVSFAGSAR